MKFKEIKSNFNQFGYTLKKLDVGYITYRNDNMFGVIYANTIKDILNLINNLHMNKFRRLK